MINQQHGWILLLGIILISLPKLIYIHVTYATKLDVQRNESFRVDFYTLSYHFQLA